MKSQLKQQTAQVVQDLATIGQVINDLVLIAAASNEEDYRDRIDYIPL